MAGTDLVKRDELTVLQKEGAFLDAQGAGPTEIAAALAINPKTVSKWRKQPAYLDERKRWQEFSMERVLTNLRSLAGQVAEQALKTLAEALVAVDAEDRPIWSVRVAAAREVGANPILRAMFAERAGVSANVDVQSSTVVTVLFPDKDGTGVVEYREEVEDGHWSVRGDDHDPPAED
jgi:hypothetical protein